MPSDTVAQPNVVPTPLTALNVTDEPFALAEALVRELRRGGYVIYLRHGAVQQGTRDNTSAAQWWKNCAAGNTQRTSAAALPNAQAIGLALAKQRIVISDVQTSEFCRAYDTAVFLGLSAPIRNATLNDISALELGLAPSSTASASTIGGVNNASHANQTIAYKRALTNYANALSALIAQAPPPGQNRLLVGHQLPAGLGHPQLALLPEGHTLIFKPDGGSANKFHFVTALSPGQWQFIGKQTIYETNQQIVIQATQPQGTAQIAATGQTIQAGAPQVVQPPVTPLTPVAPQIPMIDPAREIKGLALVTALRKGGFNLYMRHAQSNVGADQDLLKVPLWWENCTIQRNISDAGRDQAKKVGLAVRELKLPIAEVKASQFCRVRDTATLMDVAKITVVEDLNHQIGQRLGTDINALRFAMLATMPPKSKNVMMVSHTHGSARNEERIMAGIQEAEVIVYQPDGKGGAEPIARIPPADWDMLIQLAANSTNAAATPNTATNATTANTVTNKGK